MARMRARAWGFVRGAIGQARLQTAPTVNARGSPPIAGDRLIAIGQDQAILPYRNVGPGADKKSAQGDIKPPARNPYRRG